MCKVPYSILNKIPSTRSIKKNLQEIIRTQCKYKGMEIVEGYMMPDPCKSTGNYTAENEWVKFHGISKEEKYSDDVWQTWKLEVHFRGTGISVRKDIMYWQWELETINREIYPRAG